MSISARIILISAIGITLGGCTDRKDPSVEYKSDVMKTMLPVQVLNWGPRGTTVGKGFSVQKNGNSAIWFEVRGIGNANMVEVWFGDHKLEGKAIIPNEGGSAEVPASLIAKSGKVPVYLVLKPEGKRIDLGVFEVM